MNVPPFEIRRKTALYVALGVLCLALAAGFGWLAYDRSEPILWAPCGALVVMGLVNLWGLRDARTPLFVADDHGVRLRSGHDWVGLLWREMGEIRVERREGLRHDPRVKVISSDGYRVYSVPLGLPTNASPGEAEIELARRRPVDA